MKSLSLIALGGLCFSASAMAAPASTAIDVYARDPFAASAIQRGDLARAEAMLTDRRLDAGDTIRLINLGDVYWLSGRRDEAVATWRRALASRDHYDVVTAGGRTLSTYEIASEALAAHGRSLMTASR
jgi:hypothetical protein